MPSAGLLRQQIARTDATITLQYVLHIVVFFINKDETVGGEIYSSSRRRRRRNELCNQIVCIGDS